MDKDYFYVGLNIFCPPYLWGHLHFVPQCIIFDTLDPLTYTFFQFGPRTQIAR